MLNQKDKGVFSGGGVTGYMHCMEILCELWWLILFPSSLTLQNPTCSSGVELRHARHYFL